MPRTKTARVAAEETKKRARRIARLLARAYPDAICALTHESPFQLLAATILSAQTTDVRVNSVTPELFRRYPAAQALAAARQEDVEQIVKSLGFFRAKAKSLRLMAQKLVEKFGGELPRNLADMVTLPGVGRKTANVVLGTAFGIASGVVVDTHVKRIAYRLGLTANKDPVQIERDLMGLLPPKEWVNFSHRLIWHGRRLCTARSPKCPTCPLLKTCPRVGLPPLNGA
jgi:endonuclease-3